MLGRYALSPRTTRAPRTLRDPDADGEWLTTPGRHLDR
jgi:hypothetical protein